ncbi:amino acid-binding protein [Mesorhizobium sp. YC-39]|uniref:ABC transporter substrate-binding protein n=1 Tax=unclassified Mesorhizobium TaxID=325217 RepID=UPI0021E71990|nr:MULTISPECIES: glycine betaine ABC transporter substrate-binding protein [unclassified Mesorhizobium]MCV3210703.1 amino acid-binding protein [Mesorhizobium sp. YC-2]MCV3230937.1 amino acid-binding protein [Mesorhizobium sp. YC-39]
MDSRFRQHLLKVSLAALTVLAVHGQAPAADLLIAMPNWPSGQAAANIIKYGIKQKLQLDADVREMGTMTAFAGMDTGEVDVYPEIWLPNFDSLVKKYVDGRKTVDLSSKGVPATQGICVTRETADKYGVKDISDLADPKKASVFDTDGDGKGEMWIGALGWSSTSIEKIRAKSYGYEKTMTLLQMPEDMAMAAVDAAAATGQPIAFYCYSPHHIFELHDIVELTEPKYDPAKWHIVMPSDDPDWLSKSEAPVAWDASHFYIGFASSTAKRLPKVAAFLSHIDFTPEEVTEMSYALQVDRQDPAKYAQTWVANHQDRLNAWSK